MCSSDLIIFNFAANYNCSSYGAGSYTNGQPCVVNQQQGNSSSTQSTQALAAQQSGGLLENTGESLYIGLAIGIAMIIAAIVLLVGRRKKRR